MSNLLKKNRLRKLEYQMLVILYINLYSVPSKVEHLEIVNSEKRSIKIQWQPPKHPRGIIQYEVYQVNVY